jgi:transcriptional regulator
MNTQNIVKTLAEKGFSVSEQEVQSKIDAFSKKFCLPVEEAARAALNHLIETNKLSAPVKNKVPALDPTGQIQTPVAAPAPAQTAAAISDRVFKLIVEISLRVPHRLASCAEIVKEAASAGISQKQVEEAVNTLNTEGKCIEPFSGKIYPISQRKIS